MRNTLALFALAMTLATACSNGATDSRGGTTVGNVFSNMGSANSVGALGGPNPTQPVIGKTGGTSTSTNPTGSSSGTSCSEIVTCINSCTTDTCSTSCINAGSSVGRAQINAVLNCLESACPSTGICASSTSAACDTCYTNAQNGTCASQLDTCLTN